MNNKKRGIIFVFVLVVLLSISYASAVPQLINFQGKLRNATYENNLWGENG